MLEDGLYDVPPGKIATVVTHLEMLAPPELHAASLPIGVTFRKVTADLGWYRDVFSRVGAQDWLWYARLQLSDRALTTVIEDPGTDIYTLSKDGVDHALLELDFTQEGACGLSYFGLTPSLISTGSGRFLMNKAIALAWERPISRFHVHTCTHDSQGALGFYLRSGFSAVRQQIEIDDDPRLTGILPRSAGRHVPVFEKN